eukprot:5140779-Prymnesium_polylepis.2
MGAVARLAGLVVAPEKEGRRERRHKAALNLLAGEDAPARAILGEDVARAEALDARALTIRVAARRRCRSVGRRRRPRRRWRHPGGCGCGGWDGGACKRALRCVGIGLGRHIIFSPLAGASAAFPHAVARLAACSACGAPCLRSTPLAFAPRLGRRRAVRFAPRLGRRRAVRGDATTRPAAATLAIGAGWRGRRLGELCEDVGEYHVPPAEVRAARQHSLGE